MYSKTTEKPRNSSEQSFNVTAGGLWKSESGVITDLQFNYVWVSEKLEVLDLPADLSHYVQTANLLSV